MEQIKATYTIGKEKKEILLTSEEISKYGLKRVIWYHARKNNFHGYQCKVTFPEKESKEPGNNAKVFKNRLNRLVARINFKSVCRLIEIRDKFVPIN